MIYLFSCIAVGFVFEFLGLYKVFTAITRTSERATKSARIIKETTIIVPTNYAAGYYLLLLQQEAAAKAGERGEMLKLIPGNFSKLKFQPDKRNQSMSTSGQALALVTS